MIGHVLKVLHTADLHLGSSFTNLPDGISETLRREQKEILFRIIKICREQSVDLLLLAGDVFDRPVPGKEWVRLLQDCLAEIPQTDVMITPGNHDPYLLDSPWESEQWPAHVHIFTPECQSFTSESKGIQVDGSAFTGFLANEPLFLGLPRTVPRDFLRVLMWHGDLADQNSFYNPLLLNRPFLQEYDYVAMGHIHKERELQLSAYSSVLVRYPGCPQRRGFDELGESAFWLGELAKDTNGQLSQSWQTIPAGTRPFLWLTCDLTGCTDMEQVKGSVLGAIKTETGKLMDPRAFSRSLVRVTLQGRLPEDLTIDLAFLENYLMTSGCYYVQIRRETGVIRDLNRLSAQPGFTGLLMQNYLARLEKTANEQARKELEQALELVLQAGQGDL